MNSKYSITADSLYRRKQDMLHWLRHQHTLLHLKSIYRHCNDPVIHKQHSKTLFEKKSHIMKCKLLVQNKNQQQNNRNIRRLLSVKAKVSCNLQSRFVQLKAEHQSRHQKMRKLVQSFDCVNNPLKQKNHFKQNFELQSQRRVRCLLKRSRIKHLDKQFTPAIQPPVRPIKKPSFKKEQTLSNSSPLTKTKRVHKQSVCQLPVEVVISKSEESSLELSFEKESVDLQARPEDDTFWLSQSKFSHICQ